MKNLIIFCLIGLTFFYSLKSIAGQKKNYKQEIVANSVCYYFQDTAFIKNYIAANKKAYLYSKPDLSSKTKIRIPTDVMITTINRSGNFEYGDFSVSSNKTYKGWFLITDLKGIMMSPPKTNQ